MKKAILSVLLGASVIMSSVTFAQKASEDSVKQFMIASGAAELVSSSVDPILAQLPQMGATEAQIAEVKELLNVDKMLSLLVPVYQNNFTDADIKAYIDFYNSPEGKKLTEKQPVIFEESMKIMQNSQGELVSKIQAILMPAK